MHHLGHIAADYRNGVFAGTSNLVKVINGELPMTVESLVHTKREAFSKDRINAISAPTHPSPF